MHKLQVIARLHTLKWASLARIDISRSVWDAGTWEYGTIRFENKFPRLPSRMKKISDIYFL